VRNRLLFKFVPHFMIPVRGVIDMASVKKPPTPAEPSADADGPTAELGPRKLIRPSLARVLRDQGVTRGPSSRKMVPPEQTNAEAYYYLKQMQSKTPIVVRLVDGEELRGWIEWYDKDVIKLNREHAPNLLIPKRSIKYLFKEEEERMHKRKRRALGPPSSEGPSGVSG
jgi:host factor-I protein